MAAFKQSVERWRPLVRSARWYLGPHTENISLANMLVESNGDPGRVAYTDVPKGYTDSEMSCGLPGFMRRRALGLLQCAPTVVRSYNNAPVNPPNIWVTPCEMAGKTIADAQKQIEVGLYAEQMAWLTSLGRQPFKQDLTDENILMFRLCYHAGPYGFKAQLARTVAAGFPGTFAGMERYNPKWGAPDRPFLGARRMLSEYKKAIGLPATDVPPYEPGPAPGPSGGGGALLLLLALAAAAFAFKRRTG